MNEGDLAKNICLLVAISKTAKWEEYATKRRTESQCLPGDS